MKRRTLATIACAGLMAAVSAPAAEYQIIQKNRMFSQSAITIKPGDSIVFKNADDVTHNVFSVTPGMEFDIRRQPPGGSSSVPFDHAGVAEVRCSIHPRMKLMVTVKK